MRASPSPASDSRRRLLLAGGLALAALAAVVVAWLLFFAGEPPARATIDDAAGVVETATPSALAGSGSPTAGASDGSAGASGSSPDAGAATGIDGTWTIDDTVGSFDDYTSAWAGFRVDEVLAQGIGETTAIGRTPAVSGQLTIDGGVLTAATIEVDLTTITSDRPRRDDAIQRTLETSQFPTATFVLTEPVEIDPAAGEGGTQSVTAVGDLAIHGVTRAAEFALEAKLVGDSIVVVGTAPFSFADYGMSAPRAPIVVSVADAGTLELQLFFRRS